jgi:myo-inositol-1(or 4)-monophosphatase
MKELMNFATCLAKEAGSLLKQRFNQKHEILYKGDINLVTEADKMSEDLMIELIGKNYPDHGILSEESPAIIGINQLRWIIDPLDGTTNYAHRYPVFCISIALEDKGAIILGVVYDPMREEMFTAARGQGAFLNGNKIAVSNVNKISRSLLATGFPYDIRQSEENNLNYFSSMATKAQAIRRAGAAALDIAYVASGRFDGFWELKLMPWDMAAGVLLVTEAGGKITNIFGEKWNINSPNILVSNGLIHDQMASVLKSTAG